MDLLTDPYLDELRAMRARIERALEELERIAADTAPSPVFPAKETP